MQISPQRSSSVFRDLDNTFVTSPSNKRAQHASLSHHDNHDFRVSSLLSLPAESLNHITKYLDVPALLALSRTCADLHAHVKDDNTWHSAFSCQFLGDDVGYDSRPSNTELLHRVKGNWMEEFVYRSNLLNRWKRSKSNTVSHTPHYSSIHTMQLLPDTTVPSLLTASLQYGVVARSLPLTGKIIKGYISASDTGLGIGNPNAEFAPNITACAISVAKSVKTVWGYANGEVAIAHTSKVMDHLKTTSKVTRCRVEDEHQGGVVEIQWDRDGDFFLTAGVDGIVKVWRADSLKCCWTLLRPVGSIDSPCEKVAADFKLGVVAAAFQKGKILVWTGIDVVQTDGPAMLTKVANTPIHITLPQIVNPPEGYERGACLGILTGPSRASGKVNFGMHYHQEDEWYRISIPTTAVVHGYEVIRYKGGPLGPVRSLCSYFVEDSATAIIFAGDELGRVSLFDWNAQAPDDANSVSCLRRFDAHEDGAITAISCTPCVVVTGSSRGTVNVRDILTFSLLRSFASPIARPTQGVGGIIVDKDLIIASCDARVIAWKGAPIKEKKIRNLKNTARGKQFVAAKWIKRLELAKEVAESRASLADERERNQRSHSRERAQLASLHSLGLDEVEAVEYVLMLSRDEEEERRTKQSPTASDSIFFDEFDEDMIPDEGSDQSKGGFQHRLCPAPSPAMTSRVSSMSEASLQGSPWNSSLVSSKVKVSPPLRPEPMEAGFSASPLLISTTSQTGRGRIPEVVGTTPSFEDPGQFPSMSPTPSSSSASNASRPRSVSASPDIKPSSWSALVKSKSPTTASTFIVREAKNLTSSPQLNSRPSATTSGPSLLSTSLRMHSSSTTQQDERDEDEDLRLALELSLAESLSLQELK